MNTTALRIAYDRLLEMAATPDLRAADDGGWDADDVLAHLISVDAGILAAAWGVVSGSRPSYDNRIAHDRSNLDRIIAEHPGRAALIDRLRHQADALCDFANQLTEDAAAIRVPTILVSNDSVVVDEPIPLAGLIEGLAVNHVPEHTEQLAALRPAAEPRSHRERGAVDRVGLR